MRAVLLVFFCSTIQHFASAQKQVVFLVNGNVKARFTQGELFQCVLKNKEYKGGYIDELNEFSMYTTNDTIPYQSIAKVQRKEPPKFFRKMGRLLLIIGIGYVVIDQVNSYFGYNPPGFNQADWNALIIAGVGGAMLLVRPKYQKIKPGTTIRAIDYHSPYYLYDK